MKTALFIISLFFQVISMPLYAQVSRSVANDQIAYLKRENFMASSADTYKDIKGTPYMTEGFVEGTLIAKSGDKFPGEYRFDIYANRVQFMNNGILYQIAYPDSIERVEIGETTLKYLEYKEGTELKKGYFILLEDGNPMLLQQKNKSFYEALPAKPYQEPTQARFGAAKDFIYLFHGNGPAEKIASTKDVINVLGTLGADAKRIIDNEKLNVKKEEDLRKLVRSLNEM